ncbi:deoxyhypusine synthase family protein [Candidatus Daviesbacteria bacterium]|nr:deoxyhypusine synthase family protein [Candidatus Daviesbacteria bacterium]
MKKKTKKTNKNRSVAQHVWTEVITRHGRSDRHYSDKITNGKHWFLSPTDPFIPDPADTADKILRKMEKIGFQAHNLARAAQIWTEMLDNKTTIFLAVSGAIVPAGMRRILAYLIKNRYIDVYISTGSQFFHDFDETIGNKHYHYPPETGEDVNFFDNRVVRMYDVLAKEHGADVSELFTREFVTTLEDRPYCTREFLHLYGRAMAKIAKEDGIITTAYKSRVPLYCPAIGDSVIGMDVAAARYNHGATTQFDVIADVIETIKIVAETEKRGGRTGVIILGGGVARNFTQQTATGSYILGRDFGASRDTWFKKHKYGIQITQDAPQWGGLSGSTFEEAQSWGKYDPKMHTAQVFSEVTIALPILVEAVMARCKKTIKTRKRPEFTFGPELDINIKW